MTLTLLVLPVVLFLLGFPVYVVLLCAGAVSVVAVMDTPALIIHQRMYGGVENYALLAIPFFIFAGELMHRCGVSQRLVIWILAVLGRVRGSLGLATIFSSTLMGAVSGSSPATVAATGKTLYGDLVKSGYGRPFSLGLITSSGAVAVVIPPSIAMILYGASAEQSVPKLFIAGVLPGLLISAAMALYVVLWKASRTHRREEARDTVTGGEWPLGAATVHASGALLMPLVVLSGIYLGYFSPTEAGGVACLYAALLARLVYRTLSWREILDAAADSALLTAQILVIVASAAVFSWVLTVAGLPQALFQWVADSQFTAVTFLLVTNAILLLLGCFIDPSSAILVLTPILLPMVVALGIDPIHFGIVMTVNLSIGMFTPPFGLNIFVAQSVLGVDLADVYRGLVGFFLVQTGALLVITYVPSLSLWLVQFV